MINTDPELIASLVRKEYLAKEIQMLERNILAIKKMKNIYDKEFVEPTVDNVVSLISKKRQADVYKRYFYNKVEESVQFPIDYTRYGKDVIDWAMADYRRSDYRKEELKHRSSYGLLVRSKSEITIVEKYYEHKIPFRYEEVIEKDGVVVIPDFIVPDKYGKFWIWEHCGMPDNPDYMNRHKRKIEIYEKMGIVPWKNLIVTYDNEYGSIDVKTIEAEIKGKLL